MPTIADIKERAPDLLRGVYTRSYRLLVFLLVGAIPLFIVLTPVISRLWIGQYDAAFVGFSAILFVAWSLNLLANPAYFAQPWNGRAALESHRARGDGGAQRRRRFGAGITDWRLRRGRRLRYRAGCGKLADCVGLRKALRHSALATFGAPTVWLGLAALVGLAGGVLLYQQLHESWSVVVLGIVLVVGYGVIVIIPWWRHPMRAELVGWVQGALFGRSEEKEA